MALVTSHSHMNALDMFVNIAFFSRLVATSLHGTGERLDMWMHSDMMAFKVPLESRGKFTFITSEKWLQLFEIILSSFCILLESVDGGVLHFHVSSQFTSRWSAITAKFTHVVLDVPMDPIHMFSKGMRRTALQRALRAWPSTRKQRGLLSLLKYLDKTYLIARCMLSMWRVKLMRLLVLNGHWSQICSLTSLCFAYKCCSILLVSTSSSQ